MRKSKKQYTPKAIDTSSVELSSELLKLTEKLAENAHDNWAKLRMEEGWTWGAERNDALRQHPDLIPYNELTDTKKEYDRRSAMETLKAMLALGYEIQIKRPDTVDH